MKRFSLLGLLAVSMGLLTGCPIFEETTGGWNGTGGGGGTTSTGTPEPGSCKTPADCLGANETCGEDGFCHIGDCTIWGCVVPYICRIDPDMKAKCVEGSTNVGGAGGASVGGAGGAPATGGAGGAPATGGASMGGAPGTGGSAAGGAPGTGGSAAGGAPATGGAAPAGGAGGQGGMP